ncbi:hypothetical protein J0H58_14335 [bacterium]|nr:hypothetical protein [bacterium]
MGSTTFLLPKPVPAAAEPLLRLACLAGGYDQTPTPTRAEVADDRLVLTRETGESGFLVVPWPVGANGAVVVTSATVRERAEPYRLLVELARGKLNQVRSQTGEWKDIGLHTPDGYEAELADLTRHFAVAVLAADGAAADAAANRVLDRAFLLADQLVQLYVEQMFATRHQEEGKLGTRLSARSAAPVSPQLMAEYRRAFNAARVGLRWADVEPEESRYNWAALDAAVASAEELGLPVVFGPVIDLAPGMLPAWAEAWRGDLPTLAAFMCDYLETLVGRYKERIRRWVVCAGFNHADHFDFSDDDRLRLAARLFEAAASFDPDLDFSLGVAQPFGDYLVDPGQTISPLAFVDDLIRAGARVGGIELELRVGTAPRGSLARDRLDVSRLLDLFSLLGPPLDVVQSYPAGNAPDPATVAHGEALRISAWRDGPTPESQSEWGMGVAALALCKPQVRSVTWDHWDDGDPHITPLGGLVAGGRVNPLLSRLQGLRSAHLE